MKRFGKFIVPFIGCPIGAIGGAIGYIPNYDMPMKGPAPIGMAPSYARTPNS